MTRGTTDTNRWIWGVSLAAAVAYLVVFVRFADTRPYDLVGGMVIGPLIAIGGAPIVAALARRERDPWIGRIVIAGFYVKLVGAIARYFVAFDVYGGRADAAGYASEGARIATVLRSPVESLDLGGQIPIGTAFIRLVTGVVFTVTGATTVGGFFVFSTLGFVGLYLLHRAAQLALPSANHRRYATLVLLLPSHVFWPSSIGKESWLTLTIGLTAYGVARILTGQTLGALLFGLGIAGTTMVRPHFALLLVAAASIVIAPVGGLESRSRLSFARAAAVIVVVVAALAVGPRVEEFFGVEGLTLDSATSVLDETTRRSDQGGSQTRSSVNVLRQPWTFPNAFVTVLLRPFPWEAPNARAILASLESAALVALALRWRRDLAATLRRALAEPYLTFVAIYSLGFIGAWGAVANFGILSRQRTLVLPFVLVLLAAEPRSTRRSTASGTQALPARLASRTTDV